MDCLYFQVRNRGVIKTRIHTGFFFFCDIVLIVKEFLNLAFGLWCFSNCYPLFSKMGSAHCACGYSALRSQSL